MWGSQPASSAALADVERVAGPGTQLPDPGSGDRPRAGTGEDAEATFRPVADGDEPDVLRRLAPGLGLIGLGLAGLGLVGLAATPAYRRRRGVAG